MKIAALYSETNRIVSQIDSFKILCKVLEELEESVVKLDVGALPLFNGDNGDEAASIMAEVEGADGVIISSYALFGNMSAPMQAFFEYFADTAYGDALKAKPCLLLCISKDGREQDALNNLSRSIHALMGYDVVRIALNQNLAYLGSEEVVNLIERQAEDFYRIIRQKRAYQAAEIQPPAPAPVITPEPEPEPEPTEPPTKKIPPISMEELSRKHGLESIETDAQSEIINISQMFAKKFALTQDDGLVPQEPIIIAEELASSEPSPKTCKQHTQSLPHYFNHQLSGDLSATIQVNIAGDEGFKGYLSIANSQCTYTDGLSMENDIIISADDKIWVDVLKKRVTAQKAFMMGQLKVRGNFILLSKFDALFNEVP